MFCPYCGTQNAAHSQFCAGCGARLIEEQPSVNMQQPPVAEPQPPVMESQQPVYTYQPPQPVYQQPVYQQAFYQPPAPVPGKGMGVAGMVLGIISLVLCCGWYIAAPCALIGLILSIVSINTTKKYGASNGCAIAGIICCSIGLLMAVLLALTVIGTYAGWFDEYINEFSEYGQYY